VAVLKQPKRTVAKRETAQRKMSFKRTVCKSSNLLIKNTCNVDLIKNNGEAHLFLQELLE
jgi:hypothetical protein